MLSVNVESCQEDEAVIEAYPGEQRGYDQSCESKKPLTRQKRVTHVYQNGEVRRVKAVDISEQCVVSGQASSNRSMCQMNTITARMSSSCSLRHGWLALTACLSLLRKSSIPQSDIVVVATISSIWISTWVTTCRGCRPGLRHARHGRHSRHTLWGAAHWMLAVRLLLWL